MRIFTPKNKTFSVFKKQYKLSKCIKKESTINHITKGEIPLETGTYNDGLISILDIDVSVNTMKSWKWRFCDVFVPIISTAFGDLFLYSARSEKCYFFQTQYDTMEEITDSLDELLSSALLDEGIISHVLLEKKFKEILSVQGSLDYDETYILKPWLMLGGEDISGNYSKGNLTVYLDLVSQTLESEE